MKIDKLNFIIFFKKGCRSLQNGIASRQAQVPKVNISSAKYSDFKLATSTLVLSILEFIFIATSHGHKLSWHLSQLLIGQRKHSVYSQQHKVHSPENMACIISSNILQPGSIWQFSLAQQHYSFLICQLIQTNVLLE